MFHALRWNYYTVTNHATHDSAGKSGQAQQGQATHLCRKCKKNTESVSVREIYHCSQLYLGWTQLHRLIPTERKKCTSSFPLHSASQTTQNRTPTVSVCPHLLAEYRWSSIAFSRTLKKKKNHIFTHFDEDAQHGFQN